MTEVEELKAKIKEQELELLKAKIREQELTIKLLESPSKPEPKKKPKSESRTYLMVNYDNGYHKIGKSAKPEFRERTLQSQEPDVELIAVCKVDIEKRLHKTFDGKRLRGEWFILSPEDVSKITKLFEDINGSEGWKWTPYKKLSFKQSNRLNKAL